MKRNLMIIFLYSLTIVQGKDEADLPMCPTNIEFFPQHLPMHCRMPRSSIGNSGMPNVPTIIPPLPAGFQSPPPGGQPAPIPMPFPSLPGGLGLPMPMPGPMPGSIPGPIFGPMQPGMPMPMPGPMPGPMPMVSMGGPNHKLPVIVMPFYSPDTNYKKKSDERPRFPPKKRRKHRKRPLYRGSSTDDTDDKSDTSDTDTDKSSDTSSDRETWKGWKKGWKKNARKFNDNRRSSRRRHKKKKELLTPVLQYVTKDGYVIFEKKISKGEASNWLNTDDGKRENKNDNEKQDRNEDHDIIMINEKDDANDNQDKDHKKVVDTTITIPRIRSNSHRQFQKDANFHYNYEHI